MKYYCDDYSIFLFGGSNKWPKVQEPGTGSRPEYPLFTTKNDGALYSPAPGSVTDYALVFMGLQDYIIQHFINRRIGFNNPALFRIKFQQLWAQNEGVYKAAYDAWLHMYANPVYGDKGLEFYNVPIFADYWRETTGHDITTNDLKKTSGGTVSTETTVDSSNSNGGTVTVESSGNSKTTNNLMTENTGNSSGTTTNNGRTLTSDTPQSIVNASTTGNPDDITWTYASGLQDDISKGTTSENSTSTAKNTGTVDTENGGTVTTTDTTHTDVSGTTNTSTTNDNTTSDTGTVDVDRTSRDTAFSKIQETVNMFLSSPFSTYLFNKIFTDFEPLFLPYYFNDEQPFYIWKERVEMRNGEKVVDIVAYGEDYENLDYYGG